MSAPPLVAVTTSELRQSGIPTPEADPPRDEMVLGLRYLLALSEAGCLPVVVPPLPEDQIDAFLDRVDGICLSGGPDVTPATYGAAPDPHLGPTEPDLDRFELALTAAADRRSMPVLAICRGAQLVNVARGGTLHQHLPDVADGTIDHRQTLAGSAVTHDVIIRPDSIVGAAAGTQTLHVNSFHHQAVDRLGAGLRVVGRSPDDVVEAFEGEGDRFLVGVQWHSESLSRRPEQFALYRAFADACRSARLARAGVAPAAGSC